MRVGLIDVDGGRWPNLCLMKLSAWHKALGDQVEWWDGFAAYDRVYMSRVFDNMYTADHPEPCNTSEIVKGGTGYGLGNKLPEEVEHMRPDYSLYHWMPQDTAYGFLTRGCPRGCGFCIVGEKEGLRSVKVAELSEFWSEQKNVKLLDPNLLACPQRMELLWELAESGAWVDFTQGLDARLLDTESVQALNAVKIKEIHFAWDDMRQETMIRRGLELYAATAQRKPHGNFGTVYVLTNYNTTLEEDLYRVNTLIQMGYNPYVMIYNKPEAPQITRRLQRWCNSVAIRKAEPDFDRYGVSVREV